MSDTLDTPETSRRGLLLMTTGPGKGKTTAALGTVLLAAGNGMKVLVLQFLKGSWHYGELDSIAALGVALGSKDDPAIVIRQLGRGFVKVGGAETDPEDLKMVEDAWEESAAAILSGDWDLVVLDEINYAIGYGMLNPEMVAATLAARPPMSTSSSPAATPTRCWWKWPTPSPRCARSSTPTRKASSPNAALSSSPPVKA